MRPQLLYPLYAPITALPGVGARVGALLEKLAGPHVVDLCWHLPSGLIDRHQSPKIAEAEPGVVATLPVNVERHMQAANRHHTYRMRCADTPGFLHPVCFNSRREHLDKL